MFRDRLEGLQVEVTGHLRDESTIKGYKELELPGNSEGREMIKRSRLEVPPSLFSSHKPWLEWAQDKVWGQKTNQTVQGQPVSLGDRLQLEERNSVAAG